MSSKNNNQFFNHLSIDHKKKLIFYNVMNGEEKNTAEVEIAELEKSQEDNKSEEKEDKSEVTKTED